MSIIYLFEHPGEDGGTWYAATYPLGATRYYSTPTARADVSDLTPIGDDDYCPGCGQIGCRCYQ